MKNYSSRAEDYYLLRDLSRFSVNSDPFPHIVIQDPIVDSAYQSLVESFPKLDYFRNGKALYSDGPENNKRYQMTQSNIISSTPEGHPWRLYTSINSSKLFFYDFLKIFNDEIEKYYPGLNKKLSGINSIGMFQSDTFTAGGFDVLTHTSADINSTPTSESCVRGPHLDQPDKLYFGLHYMRHDSEIAECGGGLILWKHKERSKTRFYRGYREIPKEDLTISSTIPYGKNLFIMGLNTIDSVHSVSERAVGANVRKFSNSISQLNFKLF